MSNIPQNDTLLIQQLTRSGAVSHELFSFVRQQNDLIGIGCDLIEIDRVRQALQRMGEPLLARLFTERERASLAGRSDPIPSYAARFAGKEALSKTLGVGIGAAVGWHDIEILPDASGQPVVFWAPKVAALFSIGTTYLSLSHTGAHAIAFAAVAGAKKRSA